MHAGGEVEKRLVGVASGVFIDELGGSSAGPHTRAGHKHRPHVRSCSACQDLGKVLIGSTRERQVGAGCVSVV